MTLCDRSGNQSFNFDARHVVIAAYHRGVLMTTTRRTVVLGPSLAPGLAPETAANLAAAVGVRHGFFGRAGGVSSGLYASLNCGLGSADVRKLVLENRSQVAAQLGTTGDRLLTCYQVHSAEAVIVDRPWAPDAQPKADALVTRTRGLALGALAADCAPVLFADTKAGVIAAAHAGWKGALGGVVESTVVAMESLGSRRADIRAALGPCIGPEAYEVGPEFETTFVTSDPSHANYFQPRGPAGRAHFDLPRFVTDRLHAAGIGSIDRAWRCTYTHNADFFSYRRTTHLGEEDYGRQISAIMLTET
jgi:polyphenol oxidase